MTKSHATNQSSCGETSPPQATSSSARKVAADKRTITIEVSERTAEALDYYQFVTGVGAANVASSMVEFCCSSSFEQGPDLIRDFALEALNWKLDGIWARYSTRWDTTLENLAMATEQMRQRKTVRR